jgi:spore germination protein KB
MDSSFTIFSFPFAETVLFLTLFDSIKIDKRPYKIYLSGVLLSTVVTVIAILRNIFVLGYPSLGMYYFSSYTSVSVISLGDFFSRIEVLIGLAFLLDLFVKLCVSMFAASIGVSKLFKNVGYKEIIVPVGLLMLTLAGIIYSNTLEMYNWIDVYKYYAFPIQVVLPVMIFVGAEVKTRLRKKPDAYNAVNSK